MTSPTTTALSPPRMIGGLIIGLNILRRQIGAYPEGHPAVAGAAEKVVRLLRHLLRETDSLTLAFSRDTVMWGALPIERGNPVFHDYANALSSRGIAAITLTSATTVRDIVSFNRILALRREDIHAGGGVKARLHLDGLRGIEIQEIDYTQFRLVEGEPEERRRSRTPLWEELVIAMFAGADGSASTAEIAANLNGFLEENPSRRQETYATVVSSFLRTMDEVGGSGGGAKLGDLATRLHPEVQEQFLATAFSLLPENSKETEDFLRALPPEIVAAVIEKTSCDHAPVPPVLLGLLKRLGNSPESDVSGAGFDAGAAAETATKVATLLRPEQFDDFVPDVYQGKLESLLAGSAVSGVSEDEAARLREMFEADDVALKTADIVAETVHTLPESREDLRATLDALCIELLAARAFEHLRAVSDRIRNDDPHLLEQGALPEALANAATAVDKEHQHEVKAVVALVGAACADPLLERLATEDSMTVRRHLMDCILAIGVPARAAVLARLSDPRWFVVRNALVILRSFNDRADMDQLRPLLRHGHPKVRAEVMRSLLELRDREAEKRLAQEIEKGNRDVQIAALPLAEKSRSNEIIDALIHVVEKSRDVDVRKAAVRILATTGDIRALPPLDAILQTRSFLRSATLDQLKAEIVRSLPLYRSRAAEQLLVKIAAGRDENLRQVAEAAVRRMKQGGAP